MAASPIVMPKLGLTMTEGVLASWRVKPGDPVKAGDILFVVETDKISNDVEARDDGSILTLEVEEGATVSVGAVLATWTGPAPGGEPSGPTTAKVSKPAAEVAERAAAAGHARIIATPLAKRMALRRGGELRDVVGSGPRSRIKAMDIEAHCVRQDRPLSPVADPEAAPNAAPAPVPGDATRRPATSVEKTIARRLTEAKQATPHFYVLADADVTRLLALRHELNADGLAVKITVTHCLIAALGRSLARMPTCNAVWRDGEIVTPSTVDIGVAVENPRGLLVPVIRDVGQLSLREIAQRADALVRRTREGQLESSDREGGAVSISNVGMFGASFLVPIINPGQSAILGVGAPKPVFRPDQDGRPALRQEMGLVLSCDHRIHDGATAARLLDQICQTLEKPFRLLV